MFCILVIVSIYRNKDKIYKDDQKEKENLSYLFGMWTREEGEAFDKYIEESCEQIDWEDWDMKPPKPK